MLKYKKPVSADVSPIVSTFNNDHANSKVKFYLVLFFKCYSRLAEVKSHIVVKLAHLELFISPKQIMYVFQDHFTNGIC